MAREDPLDFRRRIDGLLGAITAHSQRLGARLGSAAAERVDLLVKWLHYLDGSIAAEHAKPLLRGVQSSIIEAIACISLGLIRPAIFSMRTEVELLHSWIYFDEHRVEWEYSHATGSKYPMLSQTRKYLSNYSRKFDQRYLVLARARERQSEDPYELLSIHVHAMTLAAMPSINELHSVVQKEVHCRECILLQRDVAEYLSDTLAAWYADRWADFPAGIMDSIRGRLSEQDRQTLFR